MWRTNDGATHRLQLKKQVILFPDEGELFGFQFFPLRSRVLQGFLQLTHSSFRAAISSPIPADSTRGLILKKSLIQGQVFTVMKTLRFHWITRRVSLNQERKEKQVTPDNGRAIFPIKILKKHIF